MLEAKNWNDKKYKEVCTLSSNIINIDIGVNCFRLHKIRPKSMSLLTSLATLSLTRLFGYAIQMFCYYLKIIRVFIRNWLLSRASL